jgi:hypothetical protein
VRVMRRDSARAVNDRLQTAANRANPAISR